MKAILSFLIGAAFGWMIADYSRTAQGKRMARTIDRMFDEAARKAEPTMGVCPNCGKMHTLSGCPYPHAEPTSAGHNWLANDGDPSLSIWYVIDSDGNGWWTEPTWTHTP